MQYVVLCHTNTVDRSASKDRRDVIRTHEMLRCVNRRDAERMQCILESDDARLEDGPFLIQRAYEVGVVLFTPKGKVTLSLSDVQMIASEYTEPHALAAE